MNNITSRFTGGSLAMDPADPCLQERQSFVGSKSYFSSKLLQTGLAVALSSASGALGGSLGGFAQGLGGAGNLIGGSYFQAMSSRFTDPRSLALNIAGDLNTEQHQIEAVTTRFNVLKACRFMQARRIQSEHRSGRLSRSAAAVSLEAEHKRFDEELDLARQYGVNMERRDEEFQQAASSLREQAPPAVAHGDAAARVRVAATKTIPEKRQSFESSVGSAASESKVAFNLVGGPEASISVPDWSHHA